MPPQIATIIFVVGILGLFWLGRDPEVRTSKALWIPIAWLFINASRPVSMWLEAFGLATPMDASDLAQVYLEGSPVDRAIFAILLVAGLIVLAGRAKRVAPLLRKSVPILLFFLYCAFSVFWSDYPLVTLKHWGKGIGDVVMVLIILTDPFPTAALRQLLKRMGFVLIPLSILFIKYYPAEGRLFNSSGMFQLTGVTTQKNTLGVICLIFGLGALWRFFDTYQDRKLAHRTHLLVAHGTILVMVAWLLWACNSVTSITSLLMAGAILGLGYKPALARRSWLVHMMVAGMMFVSLLALFSDLGGGLLESMGRNPTLTGRTDIWKAILPMAGNPLVGTGYESFWLGERLRRLWTLNNGMFQGIQEAHNGYLELFLNLGWIGVALLAGLIVTGYRKLIAGFRLDPKAGNLGLAFFVSELAYSFTEAGFRMMFPLWIFFLLALLSVPKAPVPENPSPPCVGLTYDIAEDEPQLDDALGVGSYEDSD